MSSHGLPSSPLWMRMVSPRWSKDIVDLGDPKNGPQKRQTRQDRGTGHVWCFLGVPMVYPWCFLCSFSSWKMKSSNFVGGITTSKSINQLRLPALAWIVSDCEEFAKRHETLTWKESDSRLVASLQMVQFLRHSTRTYEDLCTGCCRPLLLGSGYSVYSLHHAIWTPNCAPWEPASGKCCSDAPSCHVSVSCIVVFLERSYSSSLLLDMHGSDRFCLFLAELS